MMHESCPPCNVLCDVLLATSCAHNPTTQPRRRSTTKMVTEGHTQGRAIQCAVGNFPIHPNHPTHPTQAPRAAGLPDMMSEIARRRCRERADFHALEPCVRRCRTAEQRGTHDGLLLLDRLVELGQRAECGVSAGSVGSASSARRGAAQSTGAWRGRARREILRSARERTRPADLLACPWRTGLLGQRDMGNTVAPTSAAHQMPRREHVIPGGECRMSAPQGAVRCSARLRLEEHRSGMLRFPYSPALDLPAAPLGMLRAACCAACGEHTAWTAHGGRSSPEC